MHNGMQIIGNAEFPFIIRNICFEGTNYFSPYDYYLRENQRNLNEVRSNQFPMWNQCSLTKQRSQIMSSMALDLQETTPKRFCRRPKSAFRVSHQGRQMR